MRTFGFCLGAAALAMAASAGAQPVDAGRMIFFDWGKPELTGDAKATLDRLASEFAASGKAAIRLQSHSDRSGPASVNLRMSRVRGEAVAAYLETKGVPASAIRVEAFGEADALIPTADGVREVQNRRVDVIFAD